MGKLVLMLALAGIMTLESAKADEDADLEAFVQESRALVKTFAGTLKGELQRAIEEGGPLEAISVCNVKAPEVARDLSQPMEWTVGRTSHKLRNPNNAPDDWEAKVLEAFLGRAKAGEGLDTMEEAQRIESYGSRTYRYMKAIPVGQVCLACHGSDIDPALKARIDGLYPEDRATGFAQGELRGAFTITKTTAN